MAEFVSLADFLRERPRSVQSSSPQIAAAIMAPEAPDAPPVPDVPMTSSTAGANPSFAQASVATSTDTPLSDVATPAAAVGDEAAAIRAGRLFRAALADAFDLLVTDLARTFAEVVLGRELQLARADIANIARRLIAERYADGPVRLRVSPDDAHIACELPVVIDQRLQAGDAILECRSGDIDARLRVRLTGVLGSVEW